MAPRRSTARKRKLHPRPGERLRLGHDGPCRHSNGLGRIGSHGRRHPRTSPPVVLTGQETGAILEQMRGDPELMARLMYGAGLRLMECLRLRVRHLDFAAGTVIVPDGHGANARCITLPRTLDTALRGHLQRVRTVHRRDLRDGYGAVQLPGSMRRNQADAATEWEWQWVFPQRNRWVNRATGEQGRHHCDPWIPQRALRRAAREAGTTKRVFCRTLRDSFAAHLLEDGYDNRVVQRLLGHEDPKTPRAGANASGRAPVDVESPLDRL